MPAVLLRLGRRDALRHHSGLDHHGAEPGGDARRAGARGATRRRGDPGQPRQRRDGAARAFERWLARQTHHLGWRPEFPWARITDWCAARTSTSSSADRSRRSVSSRWCAWPAPGRPRGRCRRRHKRRCNACEPKAKQSRAAVPFLDCFVAHAPRNDAQGPAPPLIGGVPAPAEAVDGRTEFAYMRGRASPARDR